MKSLTRTIAVLVLATLPLGQTTTSPQGPPAEDPHAGHDHGPGEHGAPSAERAQDHGHHAHAGQRAQETVAGARETAPVAVRSNWSAETLRLAASLPIQDGGRIKPLSTYAAFTLLRFNGKRSVQLSDDLRLTPVAWLLDVLWRPEIADQQAVFLVQDDAVLEAMGLSLEGKRKRDRYSFEELRPGLPQLFDLAHQYGGLPAKERSSLQEQLVFLAENTHTYLGLRRSFDFARAGLRLDRSARLVQRMGGQKTARFDELLAHGDKIVALHDELRDGSHGSEFERAAVADVLRGMAELAGNADILALLPPTAALGAAVSDSGRDSGGDSGGYARGGPPADDAWWTPADLLERAFEGEAPDPRHVAAVRSLSRAALAVGRDAELEAELASAHTELVDLARGRGEYERIDLELAYYRANPIRWSLVLFVLAFVATAFVWLVPRARTPYVVAWGSVAGASLALLVAITMRCLIRNRPPVSTLYETVLFVTVVGAVLSLVMEGINRRRIALSAGAVLGMIGLFLANGYEALDKQDTMPSLVAVLDTNFWLATHVTAITAGYSAGLFAALLASFYLLGKLFGWRRDDRSFYSGLAKMVYGTIAFGLIFSLVGTVLGGIWATDSWGRFWGWDPKENGALLIVLSQILILHGRLGGFLKEHGVCMAAAFSGTIIAFSWWGVNLLGVGLHSYGFTSGIHRSLWTYYWIQWGIVGLGGLAAWRERITARVRAEGSTSASRAKLEVVRDEVREERREAA